MEQNPEMSDDMNSNTNANNFNSFEQQNQYSANGMNQNEFNQTPGDSKMGQVQKIMREQGLGEEIDLEVEAIVNERVRMKVEQVLQNIISTQLETKMEQILTKMMGEKIQVALDEHLENTLEFRIEDHLHLKLERILDKSIQVHIDRMVENTIQKKLQQLQTKITDAELIENKLESLTNKLESFLKIKENTADEFRTSEETMQVDASNKRKKVIVPHNSQTNINQTTSPFKLGSPSFSLSTSSPDQQQQSQQLPSQQSNTLFQPPILQNQQPTQNQFQNQGLSK